MLGIKDAKAEIIKAANDAGQTVTTAVTIALVVAAAALVLAAVAIAKR